MKKVYGKDAGLRLAVGVPLVAAGDRIFTSGLISDRPGGLESETHRVFQHALALIKEAGASPSDVVRTRVFYVEGGPVAARRVGSGESHAGASQAERLLRDVHGIVFDHPGPAFTAIRVSRLPGEAFIEIELEAVRGAGKTMKRHEPDEHSSTSAAVRWGDEVWLSGMRALDHDGMVPNSGGIFGQVDAVIRKTEDALKALGAGAPDVVSSRHWMRHDTQFDQRPASWAEFMRRSIPTSAGIAVEGVGPHDAVFMYEVDAVAGAGKVRPERGSDTSLRRNVRTGRTYEILHNYCRSVRVGQRDVVYVAGTTSIVPGEIVQHPDNVAGQVRDTLAIVRWAIEQQGLKWSDLVRTRTYIVGGPEKLDEAADALNEVVGGLEAAATLVGVPVLGRPTIKVEIEATAVKS